MKKIIITVVLTSLVFMVGFCVGQEEDKFKKYSKPYAPTLGEWRVTQMTAYENHAGYLTEKLIKKSLQVFLSFPDNKILWISVDTNCQPDWDVYLGNGRFSVNDSELRATYQEASANIMKKIKISFPEYGVENINITFYINEDIICEYTNGKMLLKEEIIR